MLVKPARDTSVGLGSRLLHLLDPEPEAPRLQPTLVAWRQLNAIRNKRPVVRFRPDIPHTPWDGLPNHRRKHGRDPMGANLPAASIRLALTLHLQLGSESDDRPQSPLADAEPGHHHFAIPLQIEHTIALKERLALLESLP
jgi:hypothetical protein